MTNAATQNPASTVLMIRPSGFGFNTQTADSNAFQQRLRRQPEEIAILAREEFDQFTALLAAEGVDVITLQADPRADTPDAVFPNNWISLHAESRAVIYPMLAKNRRAEARPEIIDQLEQRTGARWRERIDLRNLTDEDPPAFLEGTGSLVLDRERNLAYACRSPRTTAPALDAFEQATGFETLRLNALDVTGMPIYHTNVMMCLAPKFAIVCLEAIIDRAERETVLERLAESSREIIEISFDQLASFAGNALALQNREGKQLLVMSERAHSSLEADQQAAMSAHAKIVTPKLETIETVGGGSARCMLAEVFFPTLP